MQIKKGDIVYVIAGKDAGKKGKILRVLPRADKVVVEGINRVKKHQKPSRSLPQGGILQIESPLNASNVMLLCGKCNRPTRIAYKVLSNDEKVRV
ncbi:MAG: 50S ribosomal protein L24, partial [Syntrophomonadaceae bacterium]|nr:50S ribosomal protein L24 [Syntrophomonadaceae bacterium]